MKEFIHICLNAAATIVEVTTETAEKTNGTVFWDILGKASDSAGVISFLFSIPTFFIARSTKKAVKNHDERKNYKDKIPGHIDKLAQYHISIDDIYNIPLLDEITEVLQTIKIHYPSIIKPLIDEIEELERLINEDKTKMKKGYYSEKNLNKSEIKISIHSVTELLKREEEKIW